MQLTEGTIVAKHYCLLRPIGQGSFGEVWLAHNDLADIDVAIKFYGALDSQGLEDLRNEFKIAFQLNHPNLLSVSHFDVEDNCPFLVMPYCPNGSVRRRAGKMEEHEIWEFIRDVASGLAFLHSQYPPIVHQDIKPDNILMAADGRYVISDFGISRSIQTRMSRTANSFSSSGTIAYMGPERFSEEPRTVLASDVWALGMTIYEVATGDVLWGGMGGCVQLNGARIPILSGQFSQELSELVKACLDLETRNRPTAKDVQEYASDMLEGNITSLTHRQQSLAYTPTPAYIPRQEWEETNAQTPSHNNFNTNNYGTGQSKPSISTTTGNSSLFQFPKINTERIAIGAIIALACIVICAGIYVFIDLNSNNIAEKTSPENTELMEQQNQQSTVPEKQEKKQTDKQERQKKKNATPASVIIYTDAPAAKATKKSKQEAATGSTLEDDLLFSKCKTVADYNLYLSEYPNGRHRAQAKAAIQEVQQQYDRINNSLPSGSRRPHKSLRTQTYQ